jgi:hypothetical protein
MMEEPAYRLTVYTPGAFEVSEDYDQISQAHVRAAEYFRLGFVAQILEGGEREELYPITGASIRRVME